MGYEIDKNLCYQIHDDLDMYFDLFCNVGVDEEKFQHLVEVGYAYIGDEFGPGGAYADELINNHVFSPTNQKAVAAFALAMSDAGIRLSEWADQNMRWFGSRKPVRHAFSGGTYNVTYGEGFDTSSMRGVDAERVADFLEQEARFLRTNTPGRDYLMTIQIQRVD